MLTAPEPLAAHHKFDDFDCGALSLNDWLKRRAAQNQASGASRCFVSTDTAGQVVAYYALATSAITAAAAPGRFRRNMPDPNSGRRFGTAGNFSQPPRTRSGSGHVSGRSARAIHAAEAIGTCGLLVHALSDEAKAFYLKLGLDPSPLEPMTLMTTIAELQSALGQ